MHSPSAAPRLHDRAAQPRSGGRSEQEAWFRKLAGGAIGLDTAYITQEGGRRRRVYLDSTATTLRLQVVDDVLREFLPHYASTHSLLHYGAKLCTREFAWCHEMVLDFVQAPPEDYTCVFLGSGATAGLNRMSRVFRRKYPDKPLVLASIMEHHSNDLPHRENFEQVIHIPGVLREDYVLGELDLAALEAALREHEGRVCFVALTGVSNVTGIVNPIYEAAELCHRYGTRILVDAAQMAAHVPIVMSDPARPAAGIDALVFSGHKIYAPGSPGVLVARKDIFQGLPPAEIGGGVVEEVREDSYELVEQLPEREEAGTPNIVGAMGLAAALYALKKVGMELVAEKEEALIRHAMARLGEFEGLVIYGEPDLAIAPRAGAISFNLRDADHAFLAAVLNDYFNIAVRNECFCAHPYVKELILLSLEGGQEEMRGELEDYVELRRGMVRASFGIYNTTEDVERLVEALGEIRERLPEFQSLYRRQPCGDYLHREAKFDYRRYFSVSGAVERSLGEDS